MAVKPFTIEEQMSQSGINRVLFGGISLKAERFNEIMLTAFNELIFNISTNYFYYIKPASIK